MYGANSSNRILKTALGDATFAEARTLGRRASPCFAAPAFQDSPLPFMPFTTNIQRSQCVCFSPSRRTWKPPVRAPASSAVPYLGGKSAGDRTRGESQAASALAIPAEAGARECHTCIAAPTPPQLPALAQRAARPRHPEHRGL